MNTQEALKILELSPGASKEDIQAAFRKAAKTHHPDRNKDDPNAETKFKEINSAYQYLNNPQPERQSFNQNPFNQSHGPVNISDFFPGFGGGNPFQNQIPASISTVSISFFDSVLGVEKDVEIIQNYPCNNCKGMGSIATVDICKRCNGAGQKQAGFSRGNMVFIEPCENCRGTGKNQNPCSTCNQQGFQSRNVTARVRIPGGVVNDNMLRIPGGALRILVASDPDMVLEGADVVSNINISLLDALKGTLKTVRTVKGDMNLKIPPLIKNSDSVKVSNYGVPEHNGSHIFNITVGYPDDTSKLIEFLEGK